MLKDVVWTGTYPDSSRMICVRRGHRLVQSLIDN